MTRAIGNDENGDSKPSLACTAILTGMFGDTHRATDRAWGFDARGFLFSLRFFALCFALGATILWAPKQIYGYAERVAGVPQKEKGILALDGQLAQARATRADKLAFLKEHKETAATRTEEEIAATAPEREAHDEDTQFVMISFDGSRSLSSWRKTLDFAQELRSENIPVSFTYFISGVYLLPSHQKHLYNLSWGYPGKSDIDFGDSIEITDKRIGLMNRAVRDGHEIGSHLNGHFNGSKWSKDQWTEEFDFFKDIISNTLSTKIDRNIEPIFTIDDVKGLRSPLLSTNKALYKTLAEQDFDYDASQVAKIGTQPWKDSDGIWQFPLVPLTVGGKRSLSMDYNHYKAQTDTKDVLKMGTAEWNNAKQEVLDSYLDYFEQEYRGARAPIHIGHHFSMWNDGVYWEALKEFAAEVCGKPDVACTNYGDLVSYLED